MATCFAVWGWKRASSSMAPLGGSGCYSDDDGSGSLQPNSGEDDGGVSLHATSGSSPTSTSPSESLGGGQVDFQAFITLPTASVVEANTEEREEERAMKLEHIKGLALEFFAHNGNNIGALGLEKWLSELDVSWVLHLNNASVSARIFFSRQLQYLARSWIVALYEVSRYIDCWCSQEEATVGPSPSAFIRFVEATLSKMLHFVDAIVAVRTIGSKSRLRAVAPAEEKLQAMIHVRHALSTVSERILSSFRSSTCVDYTYGRRSLLSSEPLAKLDEAIWDTIDETRTGIRSSSRRTPVPLRSPDIHMVTRSVSKFIDVLWTNYGLVDSILHDAYLRGKFLPKNEDVSHLTNLITEVVDSLEEKLTRNSQSFPDQSLRFLFLINNFHFLQQLNVSLISKPDSRPNLAPPLRALIGSVKSTHNWWTSVGQHQIKGKGASSQGCPMLALSSKIEDYINSYIQVSWAPVLKCLHNPTPLCFTRHLPLQKFESKFQKTYTAQKLWKVPDPKMRKRLRTAIVEEVTPDYTEFLKNNTISTTRVAPQVMKHMLQEFFEG